MGKVSKWFKALLGTKSSKKKRNSSKSYTDDKDLQYSHWPDQSRHGKHDAGVDPTNSAVRSSVTNNTARAAAVTMIRRNGIGSSREERAAVVIQSHFRAYLSRRALRALKGLVKLQALVRGYIVRKQTADMLRRMQALIRAQSRARAGRSQVYESPHLSAKSSQFLHHGPATPDKFEYVIRARSLKNDQTSMLKRNSSTSSTPAKVVNQVGYRTDKKQGSFARTGSIDNEKIDKILEIDIGKPYFNLKQRNLFHSSDLSLNSDQCSYSMDETYFSSANNSPQLHSASSKSGRLRKGPFTPTKSIDGYSDCPNYMSYTEAAKAKARSISAPKLRPKYDMFSSAKWYSIHGESRTSNLQKGSAYNYANFTNKAYPGSGQLDKLGMPVREDSDEFSRGPWQIY